MKRICIWENLALMESVMFLYDQLFRKYVVRKCSDSSMLGQGMSAGSCEGVNELLGSVNCGEFPDQMLNIILAGKALIHGLRESVAK